MFYQVKVLDKAGKIKRIVESGELSQRYWVKFNKDVQEESPTYAGKDRRRRRPNRKQSFATVPALSN